MKSGIWTFFEYLLQNVRKVRPPVHPLFGDRKAVLHELLNA